MHIERQEEPGCRTIQNGCCAFHKNKQSLKGSAEPITIMVRADEARSLSLFIYFMTRIWDYGP